MCTALETCRFLSCSTAVPNQDYRRVGRCVLVSPRIQTVISTKVCRIFARNSNFFLSSISSAATSLLPFLSFSSNKSS